MSEVTINMIEELVLHRPALKILLDEHVSDNFGEILPHVFFGDLTRYTVASFLDITAGKAPQAAPEQELRALLSDLERIYRQGDEETQELIAVSFLENLPRPGEAGAGLRHWLGPTLQAQLRVIG